MDTKYGSQSLPKIDEFSSDFFSKKLPTKILGDVNTLLHPGRYVPAEALDMDQYCQVSLDTSLLSG